MALTKVTGSVIKDSVSLSGNVSVGGTLTYQDVTNVDALGIGTFRTGIKVLAGQVDVGSNIKLGNAGVITATSFSGSGANLTGIQVGGASSLSFNDDVNLNFGNSQDLKIYHDGDDSYIDDAGVGSLLIRTITNSNVSIKSSSDFMAKFMTGDAVELYHSGNKKFETTSAGATVTGDLLVSAGVKATTNYAGDDNVKLKLGTSDDLQIYHATAGISTIGHYHSGGEPLHITSNGDIKFKVAADNGGGGGEDGLIIKSNGAVELYHNNIKKAETYSNGLLAHHHLKVMGAQDQNAVIQMFADEGDNTEDQFLMASEHNPNRWVLLGQYVSGWHRYIQVLPQAGVQLYYDELDSSSPSPKLETTSDGITVTRNTSDTTMTNTSQLVLRNSNNGANTFAGIRFEVSSNSATDHYIVQKKHSGGSGTDLIVGHGSNERIRFIESGGITFNGDTSSNNALDDYEQGDLSLLLTGSSGGSVSYGYRTGHYTKIGNVCHVTGDIRFNGSWSGSTGECYIGLPFTAESTGGCVGAGIVCEWNLSGSNWDNIMIKVDNNESIGRFTAHSGSNNNTSAFQTNLFGNGRYLKFEFTYQTA